MRNFTFHLALMSWWKVWIQLVSPSYGQIVAQFGSLALFRLSLSLSLSLLEKENSLFKLALFRLEIVLVSDSVCSETVG